MKKLMLILLVNLMLCLVAQSQQKEFAWLKGIWKLKDKAVFESWKVGRDGKTLEGVSFRVKGTDTVAMEQIRFTYDREGFHYIPDVPGDQPPVDFRITNHTSESFVAENPQHDFPKLIRYRYIRKDNKEFIEAAIEGDGKVIPYSFEKVE
jgi:hypothetical protein